MAGMSTPCTLRRCLLTLLTMLGLSAAQANELQTGQVAPPFALKDQTGKVHQLADYAGKWLVVYFYPKDDSPGCTKEACHFRDDIAQLRTLDIQLLGISLDSAESHERFAKKFNLPFPLLADEDGKTSKQYNTYWSLGPLRFARRHSFIIDPTGRIAKIYREVDADNHSAEIIQDLKTLQKAGS